MKIVRVTAWSVHLPYVEGTYRMSGDRVTTGMDAVAVRVTADDGTVGIGESGTVGVTFDAQNLTGQKAGITVLASAVLGADPQSPPAVHHRMCAAMSSTEATVTRALMRDPAGTGAGNRTLLDP